MIELKEGLVLYHGSYCVVENPDLQKCAVYKDFGQSKQNKLCTSLKGIVAL